MKRIVVTGYGAVTPLGLNAEDTWKNIKEGKSGVAEITRFDTSDYPVTIGAEVKDFDPVELLDRRAARRLDHFQWYASVAAREAIAHSGLEITEEVSLRSGVVVSSGVGGIEAWSDAIQVIADEGPRRVNPFTVTRIMTNGASGQISIDYNLRGPSMNVSSACASASDGIGSALTFLRSGLADVMVAGGTEAGISPIGIASFHRIGAYTERKEHTPSPFSADRDGLVMGEGAGVVVLETLEHALARGAEIHGELLGYGVSSDAFHITAPTEDGSGSARAIKAAMADAKINPEDISYINAHGTGTPLNDASETMALKLALSETAYDIPISSTKSMTGHAMGSTGAMEFIFCLQAMRDGVVPPTINYTGGDEVCDLDYIPNEARDHQVNVAMSNSFGFGGHNSVLVLGRYTG